MAYTDKPVTLADVMNVRGESLIPPTPQPSEEQLLVDSEELDTGDQPTTPGLLTSAASDRPRSISVGKKRVVFLSDWPQDTEQDFALKQLVEVCLSAYLFVRPSVVSSRVCMHSVVS